MKIDNPFNLDNIDTDSIFACIEQIVKDVELDYQDNKGLILTEDDLKFQLLNKIQQHFFTRVETMDRDIYASPLHSEVSYFNKFKILRHRPDIVILQPKYLSILHSVEYDLEPIDNNLNNRLKYKNLLGKEFEFSGNSIIFELKFCKSRFGIKKREIDSFRIDIKKIQELQSLAKSKDCQIIGCIIIFNKTDKKSDDFFNLNSLVNNSLKIFYGTGKIEFPIKKL